MVRFGPIWNIWTNLGYSKGLFENENSKCFAFHVYLLLHVTYMQKKKKCMHACMHARSCWWCKIGVKWPICPNQQQQGHLLEISYIPLLFIMTPHYHRLYQISCLAANLSLEDMKQLCTQKPPSQLYLAQNQ